LTAIYFVIHFLAASAEHTDVIQSLSWKKDGTLLATSCKDKQVRILDPRLPTNSFTHMANSHQSIKDSRVVWLGDTGRILTTGFDSVSVDLIIDLFFVFMICILTC
jgi:coronin-7